MCGRARCTLRPEEVIRACCAAIPDSASVVAVDIDKYRPSFNVSPGAYVPVVAFRREKKMAEAGGEDDGRDGERRPVLQCMKWGLVPRFTKKSDKPDHYRMFNARSESIGEKASFCRLIRGHRCLVAVEGFYEWKKDGSKKQPYYIHFQDGRPIVFAALYDSWQNVEGELIYTFTILTTCSSSTLQWLHDRMPVILGDDASIKTWINGPTSNFISVVKPYEGLDLLWYPVTPAMGKPTFDGPDCIKEIQCKHLEEKPIAKFFPKKMVEQKNRELDVKGIYSSEFTEETTDFETTDELGTESFSDERELDESKNIGCPTSLEDTEKDDTTLLPHKTQGTDISGIKRDYEQLVTGSKPSEDSDDSKRKKERNVKHAGNGQATLLSYFQKS